MPISSNSYVEIDSVVSGSSPDGSSAKSAAEAAKSAAEAAASAAEAAASATSAATSATSAATSATSAATSATDSSNSATSAAASAYVTNLTYDVEIPFNEGMEMQRGYGNLDANGNRAVDFTRASTTGNINKSSISETLAIDEAQISIDGYGSFVSFTNSLLESETLDQAPWVQVGSLVVSQDGTLDSGGVNQAWNLDGVSSDVLRQDVSLPLNGESVLMYQEVKAGTSNIAIISWKEVGGTDQSVSSTIDLTTGVVSGSAQNYIETQELDNGWWGVWFANVSNNLGNTLARLDIANGDTVSGSIYVSRCMIVDNITGVKLPYIATTTTSVTRAEDNASIPSLNNLPNQGDDFTIICDCLSPTSFEQSESVIFRSGTNLGVTGGITATRANGSSTVSFFMSNGTSSVLVSTPNVDEDFHRFVFRYKDNVMTSFVDGVAGLDSASFDALYDINDDLYIGRHPAVSGIALNSYIKNFKILHTGLTDEQIAALGDAK